MAELEQLLPQRRQVDPWSAYGGLDLASLGGDELPYVVANMVSSADGSATLAGKSGGISSDLDRELFHVLRTQVDAVMAGTTTIARENYGRLVPKPEHRERRVAAGLAADPIAVTTTRNMDLPLESRLFQDAESTIVVITNCAQPLPDIPATVHVIRTPGESVDFGAAFAELRGEYGVRSLLLEGGPTMLGLVAATGHLDELFLTVTPLIAGGGPGPRIVEGPPLAGPVGLKLRSALSGDGSLFLRYSLD